MHCQKSNMAQYQCSTRHASVLALASQRWVEGYSLAGDRRYRMQCKPIGNTSRANPPKVGMHGGDYDIGADREMDIGWRWSVGVERRAESDDGRY
jgi:hypothetical protein